MAKGQGGAGWSRVVLGYQANVLDALEGLRSPAGVYQPGLAWGPQGAPKSSRNHEANAHTATALATLLDPTCTKAQRAEAIAVLVVAYFERELHELWGDETMCPDNHSHQWLSATGVSRIVAVKSREPELLDLSARLMRNTVSQLLCAATPDLQVWSACMRPIPGKPPLASSSTAWLRYVIDGDHGLPSLKRKGERGAKAWRDGGMVYLRALRWLWQHDRDLMSELVRVEAAPVRTRYRLTYYRGSNQLLSEMHDAPPGACSWCWVPLGLSDEGTLEAVRWDGDGEGRPGDPAGALVVEYAA